VAPNGQRIGRIVDERDDGCRDLVTARGEQKRPLMTASPVSVAPDDAQELRADPGSAATVTRSVPGLVAPNMRVAARTRAPLPRETSNVLGARPTENPTPCRCRRLRRRVSRRSANTTTRGDERSMPVVDAMATSVIESLFGRLDAQHAWIATTGRALELECVVDLARGPATTPNRATSSRYNSSCWAPRGIIGGARATNSSRVANSDIVASIRPGSSSITFVEVPGPRES